MFEDYSCKDVGYNKMVSAFYRYFDPERIFNIYTDFDPELFNNPGMVGNLDFVKRRDIQINAVVDEVPDLGEVPAIEKMVENYDILVWLLDRDQIEEKQISKMGLDKSFFMVDHGRDVLMYNKREDKKPEDVKFIYFHNTFGLAQKRLKQSRELIRSSRPITDF